MKNKLIKSLLVVSLNLSLASSSVLASSLPDPVDQFFAILEKDSLLKDLSYSEKQELKNQIYAYKTILDQGANSNAMAAIFLALIVNSVSKNGKAQSSAPRSMEEMFIEGLTATEKQQYIAYAQSASSIKYESSLRSELSYLPSNVDVMSRSQFLKYVAYSTELGKRNQKVNN